MNSEDPAGAADGRYASAPTGGCVADLGDVMLPSGPGLPRAARAVVLEWLDGCAPVSVLRDAQLLVSELVTNSCLHADGPTGTPVRIRAGTNEGALWCEVGDSGRSGVVSRGAPSLDGSGGFGLHIVDLVAAEWGVTHLQGTEVWFTLVLPTAQAA